MRNSIQTRLGIILILTATVILSVYALFNHVRDKTVMKQELLDLNDFWVKQLSKTLTMPVWNFDNETGAEVINSTMLEKQIDTIIIRDKEDAFLYGATRDNDWNIIPFAEKSPVRCYVKAGNILKDGGRIGSVEVRISTLFMEKKLRYATVSMFITVMILNVSIISLLFISVRQSIIRPVSSIAGSVRLIASGNFEKSVHSERKDEIGQLALYVEKMRVSIKDLTENLKEQERLKSEMELARKIQTSLLPSQADSYHPDFKIASAMVPADQVGGDFYDITYDRAGNIWYAIGDVSGHGVTPGLIMMMAQTAHATITANIDCEARDLVIKVNEILYRNVHERLNETHFMTFTALKYLGEGRFQHAGAHLSLIIYRQKTKSTDFIKTKGIYLNFKKDISKGINNQEFRLEPGDVLVLYTDGLTEAQNADGNILDIEGFVKIIETHVHQDVEDMKTLIMEDVLRWCDHKRLDDMSIVIIKRKEG